MVTSNAPAGPLISAAELAPHLEDQSWIVVDCRFDLARPAAGEAAYLESHIPCAVYAHLDRDLSVPPSGRSGRHPLPTVEVMTATLGRLGVGTGLSVVAYDQDHGMYASRLWWMLRYLGHDAVRVLDGGFAGWCAEGRPVAVGQESRAPHVITTAAGRRHMLVTAGEVARVLGDSAWRLLDARAAERFRGDVEPLDPVAGHIPGAINAPWIDNVGPDGRMRAPAELRRRFERALSGVAPDHAIAYCGSGVSACHDLLGMEAAGLHGARLYAGSWSEWCADPTRPVARGE